jgi:hypothetical protein
LKIPSERKTLRIEGLKLHQHFYHLLSWKKQKNKNSIRFVFIYFHFKILLEKLIVTLFFVFFLIAGAIRTMETLDLETKPHYWLTVCAQDQAVVSLYSCVQVNETNII